MTEQDKPQFLQCLNRLAVAFRARDAVDATLMQVYFETLADWSIAAVEDAGAELQRSGGAFFPTTATWYEEAARQAAQTAREEQQRERERWDADHSRLLPASPETLAALEAARTAMFDKWRSLARVPSRGESDSRAQVEAWKQSQTSPE